MITIRRLCDSLDCLCAVDLGGPLTHVMLTLWPVTHLTPLELRGILEPKLKGFIGNTREP